MKHIKLFEDLLNYNVEIFTINQAKKFYEELIEKYPEYKLKDKIHYFDYNDFYPWFPSDRYSETCRFIIAYNDKDVLGICKFAHWDSGNHYAISYLSTNHEYLQMGVSKKILEKMFKYFSETYPDEVLNFSGYSVEGWKYLRKNILEFAQKYNVKIKEQGIQYPGRSGGFSKEDYELMSKSSEEVKKIYGEENYY